MNTASATTPLAIVGIGCLFPKADGPGYFWANVKSGTDCIGPVPPTHWNPDDYFDPDPKRPDMTYARRGGFLSAVEFNPLEFGIAPRDIEATDTTQLLGLVAAKQALTDAGVRFADQPAADGRPAPGVARDRVSVILGVTGTLELVIPLGARLGHPKWKRAMKEAGIPDDAANDAAARIAESYVPWQENSFPGLLGNVVAGRIANKLDLHGTNCVVDAACASSLSAVHLAALELQAGRSDVVVTGGADTFNDIFMYMCFSKTPALSPTGDAKPFDANGDGTILGEGLGVVVLKRLADAERDGDRVYAVVRGIGSSSDGKGNAIYAPSAKGQVRALRNAYREAGVTPDSIELVEAHGTGTKVGDTVEITALTEVYGGASEHAAPWCAIGSVKSQIGHTKAAAGAASLIKAALAVYNKVLPPTLKVSQPVEPLRAADSPFYVNTVMRPWLPRAGHPRRAALSAFGFGGSNFHAVLEEHTPAKTEPDWDGSVQLLAVTGETPQAVAAGLDAVPASWPAFMRSAEASRSAFRPDAPCRLVLVAHRDRTDLLKLVAAAKAKLAAEPNSTSWHLPDGAYFGAGPAPGLLAVLFPGQGSQYPGMLRELACLFPEVLDTLAAANRATADDAEPVRLTDRVYPPPAWDADAKTRQEADLRDTRRAQPALGATGLGAWRVLSERFGLAADAFAGHSYGELVALCAAGRVAPDDLFKLSKLRGELMARRRDGDPGAMLAVFAPLDEVEATLAAANLKLVVANQNAPKQAVLSGATNEVKRADEVFTAKGVRCTKLPVAAAFHSEFVADAAVPFRSALEGVAFAETGPAVFANTTAEQYPGDPAAAKDLLASQLARPVLFVGELRAMHAAGVRTFLEVGPGAVLARLAEQTVPDAEVFGVDASGGKRPGVLDLGHALARLAARGHAVTLSAWEAGTRCRPPAPPAKPGLTVPISGANVVAPREKRPPRPPLASANGQYPPNGAARPTPRPGPARVSPMHDGPPPGTPADPNAVAQALLMTQQSLAALQRMQEQTAALHRQFLESQEAAQRTLQALVDQQQSLLGAGFGVALPPLPAVAVPAPVPTISVPLPPPVMVTPLLPPPAAPKPAAVAAPVPPPPPPPPAPKKAAASNAVHDTLLAVVSEKTGYPADSLSLGLSLDADLGIDSIKRVEILSALQERLPAAPQVKPEHLGALHTLQDVADFLGGGGGEGVVDTDNGPPPTLLVGRGGLVLMEPANAPAPAPMVPAAPPTPAADSDITTVLLAVVSEKTGYPADSLSLGLSLDADLGIDSIKRVEILSALQERLPAAPQVKPEHLGALHTLQDVADFLAAPVSVPLTPITPVRFAYAGPETTKLPRITPAPEVADALTPSPSQSELTAPKTEQVSKIRAPQVSDSVLRAPDPQPETRPTPPPVKAPDVTRTGVPAPDKGIDRSILQAVDLDPTQPRVRVALPPGAEVWVVGEPDELSEQVVERFAAAGFAAKLFGWGGPGGNKPAGPLAGLVLIAPPAPGPDSGLCRQAFLWLQAAGPKLRQTGRQGAAVLASVARLDGAFGMSAELDPDADPTAGGLAGILKTARFEWPEVTCKAIDLAAAFADPGPAAAAVADEVLTSGPLEVGIASTHRCALELARAVRRAAAQPIALGPKDVVLVTGGARGVTAEVAVALAGLYKPTVVLTGRTPKPGPEPAWLAGVEDEAGVKKAIAAHLGAGAGPRQIGDHFHKVTAQREVRNTVRRIEEAGARVAYFPVDAADGRAVADLLQQVRAKFGPVTGVVHGAGVLADKRIEDLAAEDFDRVYATKVDGLRNLLDLLAHEDLKALVLFSSSTARFGRTGQVAYAAANEVLNKTAQVEARRRPGCRVVAVNWGPWEGGMVTLGLRRVFESEGVGLIPLADGAAFLASELNASGKAVEVVAIGKARPPAGTGAHAALPTGTGTHAAIKPTGTGTHAPVVSPPNPLPTAELALAFERTLDVASHPVLRSHVLDGRAVLPMALHLEWLAHAALHGNPGLVFHGFNELRITAGVQVDDGAAVPLRVFAGKPVKQDKLYAVPVELRGRRRDGREVIHSKAEIVLVSALPKPPAADRPPAVVPFPGTVEEAYRELLFHGPDLHGIARIDGAAELALVGVADPAPPPAEWLAAPLRSGWVADPLVLDASFQMMILWSQVQHQQGSLPNFAGRYRQFRRGFPAGPVKVVIRVTRDNGQFARADIDYLDADGQVVAQMQDYECIMTPDLNQSFRRNRLPAAPARS